MKEPQRPQTQDVSNASTSQRFLLVSYEFSFGTFSGNGILAQSLVKSLLSHGCHVTVWCCRPPLDTANEDKFEVPPTTNKDRLKIYSIAISNASQWRRLDADSAWKEFTWKNLAPHARDSIQSTAWDAIWIIDWTGFSAWESMSRSATSLKSRLLLYLNFRVYSSGIADRHQHDWYDEKERRALQTASILVALSQKDQISLRKLLEDNDVDQPSNGHNGPPANHSPFKEIHIVVPPLRGDVQALAQGSLIDNEDWVRRHLPLAAAAALEKYHATLSTTTKRVFVTCIVRLSPEKETLRFVRFVQKAWQQHRDNQHHDPTAPDWIPVLAGASSDPVYAQRVTEELLQACPQAVILDSFLPPASLAALLVHARLNFHPCSYDAYGMTIMEAAAFGVPSVLSCTGVGAAVHVPSNAGVWVDFGNGDHDLPHEAVAHIVQHVDDLPRLEEMGQQARQKALAWDELAYGQELLRLLESHQRRNEQ